MGDEEGDYFDGGDETVVADPEPGCGQKFQAAVGSCCLGLILFPLSLYLLGWNEQNFVCAQKQIVYAEDNAREWPCATTTGLGENQIYHFSCPFDQASISEFSGTRFNPTNGLGDHGLQTLLNSFRFRAIGGSQIAQIYTCEETRHERTEGSGENRRTVISYTYGMAWRSITTEFHQNPLTGGNLQAAQRDCPTGQTNWQGAQPSLPAGIDEGMNTRYADSVTAAGIGLPDTWIEQIAVATMVTESELVPAVSPVPSLPAANSPPAVAGGWRFATDGPDAPQATITNCASLATPSWGCVKLTYRKTSATQASVIANVGTGAQAGPQITPSSWCCGEDEYYAFYPGTEAMTLAQIIEREHSSNSTQAWVIRICGLLLAWAAVFCLFSPVTFAADVFGDCLAFIPCVGGLMEDIVEGVVNLVVCCISCSIGCSCGLCVIAIVMLVMRPLYGGLLLLFACCLIGASFALSSQAPRKQRPPADEETELMEES